MYTCLILTNFPTCRTPRPRNPRTGMSVRRSTTQRTASPRTGRSPNTSPTQMPRSPTTGMMRWTASGSHPWLTTQSTRYRKILKNGKKYLFTMVVNPNSLKRFVSQQLPYTIIIIILMQTINSQIRSHIWIAFTIQPTEWLIRLIDLFQRSYGCNLLGCALHVKIWYHR